jgi:hypothetical protein
MVDQVTDSKDKIDPKERCLALLTLQLRELHLNDTHQIPDLVVSDEDLIALLNGTVDAENRARILHALANDKESYRRWLDLVASGESNIEDRLAEQPDCLDHASKSSPWLWFGEWIKPLYYSGAVMASAAFAYFMIFTGSPLHQSQIDELYAEFDSRSLLITNNLTSKSANTWYMDKSSINPSEDRSALLRIVADGMQAGLNRLGAGARIPGVEIGRVDEQHIDVNINLAKEDRDILYAMGRLLTLSYFHCQQSDQASFFTSAHGIYQEMGSKLHQNTASSADLKSLKALSETQLENNKSTAKEYICTFTADIMQKLRSE